MVIRVFIPATTANDLRLRRIFYLRLYAYIYVPILILENESVFPFLMFSAKQGNYWYHFYNVFGITIDWGLNQGPPALDASTLDESVMYTILMVDINMYINMRSYRPHMNRDDLNLPSLIWYTNTLNFFNNLYIGPSDLNLYTILTQVISYRQ